MSSINKFYPIVFSIFLIFLSQLISLFKGDILLYLILFFLGLTTLVIQLIIFGVVFIFKGSLSFKKALYMFFSILLVEIPLYLFTVEVISIILDFFKLDWPSAINDKSFGLFYIVFTSILAGIIYFILTYFMIMKNSENKFKISFTLFVLRSIVFPALVLL